MLTALSPMAQTRLTHALNNELPYFSIQPGLEYYAHPRALQLQDPDGRVYKAPYVDDLKQLQWARIHPVEEVAAPTVDALVEAWKNAKCRPGIKAGRTPSGWMISIIHYRLCLHYKTYTFEIEYGVDAEEDIKPWLERDLKGIHRAWLCKEARVIRPVDCIALVKL